MDSVGSSVDRVLAGERSGGIAVQLERAYGLGGDPRKRRMFYRRVEAWVAKVGDRGLVLLAEARAGAVSARAPDRYFTAAMNAKMAEASILVASQLKGGA